MDRKRVSLALQGGASRGAYVWGVLDRLLEDGRLEIDGISGTSAGAINGALVAQGLDLGGPARARELLEAFWRRISQAHRPRRRRPLALARLLLRGRSDGGSTELLHALIGRLLVPYELDASNMDPLRRVLSETLDFERLRRAGPVRLFVNATNVRTNQIRVFAGKELGLDALCASSCLPFLFDPVEIDGEPYWDGAFLGNPAIYPLIYGGASSDILLVQSSPLCVEAPPASAAGLLERISEVAFTSTLIREMRSIAFVTDLLEQGKIKEEAGMRRVRMHVIEAEPAGGGIADEGRFDARWPVLERLRDRGRRAAESWLAANFEALGVRSTLDLGAFV